MTTKVVSLPTRIAHKITLLNRAYTVGKADVYTWPNLKTPRSTTQLPYFYSVRIQRSNGVWVNRVVTAHTRKVIFKKLRHSMYSTLRYNPATGER